MSFFFFLSLRISVGLRSGTWTRTGVRNPMLLRHFNVRVSHSTYSCHISKRIPSQLMKKKKKKRASRYGNTLCGTCRGGLGPLVCNKHRPGPPSSFLKTRAGSRRGSQKGLEKPTRPRARAWRKPRTALQGQLLEI